MFFIKASKKIPKIRKTLKKLFLVMVKKKNKPSSIFMEEQSSKGLGFYKKYFGYFVFASIG